MVALWQRWRGGELRLPFAVPTGVPVLVPVGRLPGQLPFPGALVDQPSCVIAAFGIMDDALAKIERIGREDA